MNQFNPIVKVQDKMEVSAEKPVEKKEVYQGSMRVHPGQKCFEYNFETHQIKEAEYEKVALDFGQTQVSKKLLMKKNCGYAVALNKKNAMKKLEKLHGFKLKVS